MVTQKATTLSQEELSKDKEGEISSVGNSSSPAYPARSYNSGRWRIFLSSVFFVLGFSIVFSIVGVLLQSVLQDISYSVQTWLGRIGGTIIILFGLLLIGLLRIPWLEKDHKLRLSRRFGSSYITSLIFGAAFAVGWTPCVGAVLGAILTLAATHPSQSFFLLLSYSIGLGLPFLLVGLFTSQAKQLITNQGKWISYTKYPFGVLLIIMGILVFTDNLSRIANTPFLTEFLPSLHIVSVSATSLTIGFAFIAGLASFLSPCVLPLIPAFLTYLASQVTEDHEAGEHA